MTIHHLNVSFSTLDNLSTRPRSTNPAAEEERKARERAEAREREHQAVLDRYNREVEAKAADERARAEGTTLPYLAALITEARERLAAAEAGKERAARQFDRFERFTRAGLEMPSSYGLSIISADMLSRALADAEIELDDARANLERQIAKLDTFPISDLDRQYAKFLGVKPEKLDLKRRPTRIVTESFPTRTVVFELFDGTREIAWSDTE